MKKYTISFLLTFVSIFVYSHDFEKNGIFYNFIPYTQSNVEVTFKGETVESFKNEYKGDIVIPSYVIYNGKTYTVKSVGKSAFEDCIHLNSIELSCNIVSVGESAFSGCTSLSIIKLPNDLSYIMDNAFSGCTNLQEINLPENIKVIGKFAFSCCKSLKYITLPKLLERLQNSTFLGCENLKGVIINEHIEKVCYGAFDGCWNLLVLVCLANYPPECADLYLEAQNNQKQPEITIYKPLIINTF